MLRAKQRLAAKPTTSLTIGRAQKSLPNRPSGLNPPDWKKTMHIAIGKIIN